MSAAAAFTLTSAALASPTVTITEVSGRATAGASWQLAPAPVTREATAATLPMGIATPWAESWGDLDPYSNDRPYGKARATLSAAAYPIGFGASHTLSTYVRSTAVFDAYASASISLDFRFTLSDGSPARMFWMIHDRSPATATWTIRDATTNLLVWAHNSNGGYSGGTESFSLVAGSYRFTFTDGEFPPGRFGVASGGGGFHLEIPSAGSSALFATAILALGAFRRR